MFVSLEQTHYTEFGRKKTNNQTNISTISNKQIAPKTVFPFVGFLSDSEFLILPIEMIAAPNPTTDKAIPKPIHISRFIVILNPFLYLKQLQFRQIINQKKQSRAGNFHQYQYLVCSPSFGSGP